MENASKALLIAGAILIAILLIGIAMMVFGNINGITGMAGQQVDAMEIQGFNRQFKQYEGKNVSGSNVKTLINNVKASNSTCKDDASRQIEVQLGTKKLTGTGDNELKVSDIKANYRYTVECKEDPNKKTGDYISLIVITKND